MTYILSDIHGRLKTYHNMLNRICFSEKDELYILGDVIDRNPDGIEILKEIMIQPNVHMLLGNHEYMMLNVLTDDFDTGYYSLDEHIDLWYWNGGEVTHQAFLNEPEDIRKEIIEYLRGLPVNQTIAAQGKEILLVHAAPEFLFKKPTRDYANAKEFAVWERIDPWEKIDFPQDVMICGHTPTRHFVEKTPMSILKNGKIFWIDCGCAYGIECGGRLACLNIDAGKVYYENAV